MQQKSQQPRYCKQFLNKNKCDTAPWKEPQAPAGCVWKGEGSEKMRPHCATASGFIANRRLGKTVEYETKKSARKKPARPATQPGKQKRLLVQSDPAEYEQMYLTKFGYEPACDELYEDEDDIAQCEDLREEVANLSLEERDEELQAFEKRYGALPKRLRFRPVISRAVEEEESESEPEPESKKKLRPVLADLEPEKYAQLYYTLTGDQPCDEFLEDAEDIEECENARQGIEGTTREQRFQVLQDVAGARYKPPLPLKYRRAPGGRVRRQVSAIQKRQRPIPVEEIEQEQEQERYYY